MRVTWADFARWTAKKYGSDVRNREREDAARFSSSLVASARDARLVLACMLFDEEDFEQIREEWLDELARDGVEPPDNPAGLSASSLKLAIDHLSELADKAETFASSQRRGGLDKKAAYNCGRHEAYRDAVRALKTMIGAKQ